VSSTGSALQKQVATREGDSKSTSNKNGSPSKVTFDQFGSRSRSGSSSSRRTSSRSSHDCDLGHRSTSRSGSKSPPDSQQLHLSHHRARDWNRSRNGNGQDRRGNDDRGLGRKRRRDAKQVAEDHRRARARRSFDNTPATLPHTYYPKYNTTTQVT
jgi:hypothetical protein